MHGCSQASLGRRSSLLYDFRPKALPKLSWRLALPLHLAPTVRNRSLLMLRSANYSRNKLGITSVTLQTDMGYWAGTNDCASWSPAAEWHCRVACTFRLARPQWDWCNYPQPYWFVQGRCPASVAFVLASELVVLAFWLTKCPTVDAAWQAVVAALACTCTTFILLAYRVVGTSLALCLCSRLAVKVLVKAVRLRQIKMWTVTATRTVVVGRHGRTSR